MQKIFFVAMLGLWLFVGCNPINDIEDQLPQNDYKVHVYYVVPADKSFSQANTNRVGRAILEMQSWYQTATGGITFELLDEENTLEVYFADEPTTYYKEDWWNLLLNEMKEKGEPIHSLGTITIMWIEGITELSDLVVALGGDNCGGNCGAALLPIYTIIDLTWPPADMGISFHEMGHALGLSHPVEEADLPLASEDLPKLYSVMCQKVIRTGRSNNEHGFLTFEKEKLATNPFLKFNVVTYQNFWGTNIINYPVTGPVPEPEISAVETVFRTINFNTNISNAQYYYWVFGDGTISNEESPTHLFAKEGLYNVSLLVTDSSFMANRISKYVRIQ